MGQDEERPGSAFSDISDRSDASQGKAVNAPPRKTLPSEELVKAKEEKMKQELERREQEYQQRLLRPVPKKPPSDGSGFSDVSGVEGDENTDAVEKAVPSHEGDDCAHTGNDTKEQRGSLNLQEHSSANKQRESRDADTKETGEAGHQHDSKAGANSVEHSGSTAKERLAKFDIAVEVHREGKCSGQALRASTWHSDLLVALLSPAPGNTEHRRRRTWQAGANKGHAAVVNKSQSLETILSPVGSGMSAARLLQAGGVFSDVLPP